MLLESVKSVLVEHGIPVSGLPVVVGVSGGVDSVVLLEVFLRLQAKPIAVHVNFGLRGEESNADEAFVRTFCGSVGAELVVREADPSERDGGNSTQEWARNFRYEALREVAENRGASFVAVAHHEDDQAETVLAQLFRGAGLAGLAGMPFARPILRDSTIQLIRPLLTTSRRDILAYARLRELDWRDDSSNLDPSYLRTTIRQEILSAVIRHFGDDVKGRIASAARIVREAHFKSTGAEPCGVVTVDRSGRVEVSIRKINVLPEIRRNQIVLEVLRCHFPQARRTRQSATEILSLIDAQVGRRWESARMSVTRERDLLLFSRETPDDEQLPVVLTVGAGVRSRAGYIRADLLSDFPSDLDPGTLHAAFVDADLAGSELQVDRWREGDRVTLLGGGTQKVSDLLTDARVPHHQRKQIRVVRSADGRVVWIAGVRVSGEFAVHVGTRRILMLTQIAAIDGNASDLASPPVS